MVNGQCFPIALYYANIHFPLKLRKPKNYVKKKVSLIIERKRRKPEKASFNYVKFQ